MKAAIYIGILSVIVFMWSFNKAAKSRVVQDVKPVAIVKTQKAPPKVEDDRFSWKRLKADEDREFSKLRSFSNEDMQMMDALIKYNIERERKAKEMRR